MSQQPDITIRDFRAIVDYFRLPRNAVNRPGSIRFDADTIKKLRHIEAQKGLKITGIAPQCPLVDNKENYSNPWEFTHWWWEVTGPGPNDGKWQQASATTGPWIGNIIISPINPEDNIPTPTPQATSTPTSSRVIPTPTPTKTVTKSITPTPTITITPSITSTSIECPLATPTPTITPGLDRSDCLLHIRLTNLKPVSTYRSFVEIPSDSTTIAKPQRFGFVSMNDGTQNIWILLSRIPFNEFIPISIRTQRLASSRIPNNDYEADHVVSLVYSRNCGCVLSQDCNAQVIEVSTDIDTTVNYDGCLRCGGSNPIEQEGSSIDRSLTINDNVRTSKIGTMGTLGFESFYGTYDQSGNVWEWTESGPSYKIRRYLRGGSFLSSLSEIDSSSYMSRKSATINSFSEEFGFRVASWSNPHNFPCFVDIADSCNVFDSNNGLGRVKSSYKIHKYAVSNYEYMTFLNSVAFDKSSDSLNLYKPEMETDTNGGIIRKFNTNKQRYEYATKENMEHKPVNFIAWVDAARYCNWLNNFLTTTDTETGAYNLQNTKSLPTNLLTTTSALDLIDTININNSLINNEHIWKLSAFEKSSFSPAAISKRLASLSDIIVDNNTIINANGLSIDIKFKENIEVIASSSPPMLDFRWCGSQISTSAMRIRQVGDQKTWNIFIPKHLINRDGSYSLTIGNPSLSDILDAQFVPNTIKLLTDPIIIFFIVDQNNNILNLDANSFEGANCYRDFGVKPSIDINIERLPTAKYFLPNEDEWYKAAYYDAENFKYYKYATKSNRPPFCPRINLIGDGPYYRDIFCDCPEIKICDVELLDITDEDYTFSLNITKDPECCSVEYRLITSTNDQNWTPVESNLLDCDPYLYPPVLCTDLIP